MKPGLWNLTAAGVVALGTLPAAAQEAANETAGAKPAPVLPQADDGEGTPVVQIALLLDTSGSMSGLIAQAKTQLWSVVNEFIAAKQDGRTPVVQVALFEYGKSSLSQESNWIREIQPLTRDLDSISGELFALNTNGGDEYCGAVIEQAVKTLAWDASSGTYKAIFIAGNEPFTQGPVKAGEACKGAIARGIIVNTIHCGEEGEGISGGWKQGALLADGSFMVIDQDQAVAHIEAPQDEQILRLNEKLNDTYIAYGEGRQERKENQLAQDANAAGVNKANLVRRAATKASANYFNAGWDIVDASQQKGFDWAQVKVEDLPEELGKLTPGELKAHVEELLADRKVLQAQILELSRERDSWVAGKLRERGDEDRSLGGAVSRAVRSQATAKGIIFTAE